MGISTVPISASSLAALECTTPIRDGDHISVMDPYRLEICQDPGCATISKENEQPRILQPFPIVKLVPSGPNSPDPNGRHIFLHCTAYAANGAGPLKDRLDGTTIIPIQQLNGPDGNRENYFIFSNLSFKIPGSYKLKYTLIEVTKGRVFQYAVARSQEFPVFDQDINAHGVPTSLQLTLTQNREYRNWFSRSFAEESFTKTPGIFRAESVVQLEAPIAHIFNGWVVNARLERFGPYGNMQVWECREPERE
ncbi:predicted protein [Uncinocarpus reesii 1704]|uniref:Velvet domain-containing protein n=1 Tax=Uncinocarpus reesii (strain UAMH 1704) TaxID=336963 RepID=C4JDM5_UNCRE|nr:uncharacterized protein UREG_00675 [Uncinocarpus reesii 1704]EEP75828.1 predicted protein [Uncinocarpus reesii 1704]